MGSLFAQTAAAAPGEALPKVDAERMVAGVTVAKVASQEIKVKADPKVDQAGRDPATENTPEESVARLGLKEEAKEESFLPSRLELTAGTDGLVTLSDASNQISLFAEGRYRLNRYLQIGGSLAYRYQGGDETSASAFQALVGPTFNFGWGESRSLGNAFFVSTQAGVTTGQTKFGDVVVGSNTQATFAMHAGKRFQLGQSVSYAPSVGVVKQWSFGPSFVVQPIALSVFF
jgi:hypothetical protein